MYNKSKTSSLELGTIVYEVIEDTYRQPISMETTIRLTENSESIHS